MLTDEEREFAAQVAERFPAGQGGAWFSQSPFGFFLDPQDDVQEAAAVLALHPLWEEYGDPAVRLAGMRCRAQGWRVGWQDLHAAWQDLEASLGGEYNHLIDQDPEECARRLRAGGGSKEEA